LAADRETIEHSEQSLNSVGGELDGAGDSVDEPTQDDLQRRQRAIALEQFLQAYFVLSPLIVFVIWGTEDSVDTVEQDAPDSPASALAALDEGHEVVDIAIDVPQGALVAVPDARRLAPHRPFPRRVDVNLGNPPTITAPFTSLERCHGLLIGHERDLGIDDGFRNKWSV
ncbi:hypothetical protein THAOC_24612, partial [Thalassiosira oceanica]